MRRDGITCPVARASRSAQRRADVNRWRSRHSRSTDSSSRSRSGASTPASTRRTRRVLAGVDAPERDLELLSVLLECLERQRFTSARLRALRDALATGHVMPSRRIAALARLMSWLDSTRNQFFAPVALLLLLRS